GDGGRAGIEYRAVGRRPVELRRVRVPGIRRGTGQILGRVDGLERFGERRGLGRSGRCRGLSRRARAERRPQSGPDRRRPRWPRRTAPPTRHVSQPKGLHRKTRRTRPGGGIVTQVTLYLPEEKSCNVPPSASSPVRPASPWPPVSPSGLQPKPCRSL